MTDRNFPHRRNFILPGFRVPAEHQGSGEENFVNAPTIASGPLITFSQNAMGCEFQVLCPAGEQAVLANAIGGGFQLIQDLEQKLSIYRPSSQMSHINRTAGRQAVPLDDEWFELLSAALRLSQMTNGAFDVTAGPLSQMWRSHRRAGTLPSEQAISQARGAVGFDRIALDTTQCSIRFEHPQTTIDLGAIGKGYALDRLSELLETAGAKNFLIHGGQSSVLARGSRHSDNHESKPGWVLGISHPLRPHVRLAELRLGNEAIGTSGSGRQHFVHHGRRYSHIIDPRTGWPPDQALSATVIADSAMAADALATAAFILGPSNLERLCHEHRHVAAVIIRETKAAGKLQIDTFNLADDRIRWLT